MLHNKTSNKRFIIQHAKLLCPWGRTSRIFIYGGMNDRSMRSGTKLARKIQLTDWSTTNKPVQPVLWSTNTAWYFYSFWALFVLYKVQLDNKVQYSTVNQGCMSLSTYYLENGRHLARRLCRRCRAYTPTSNTASHQSPWENQVMVFF